MATEAQIAANRANAQASTGPVTAAGKANSSRNALSSGLFSKGDFVRADEHDQYAEFCAAIQKDLAPQGAIEQTMAAGITHAAWRLRRCSAIEATLAPANDLDPIADEASEGRAWQAPVLRQLALSTGPSPSFAAFRPSVGIAPSSCRRTSTSRPSVSPASGTSCRLPLPTSSGGCSTTSSTVINRSPKPNLQNEANRPQSFLETLPAYAVPA